MLLTKIFLGDFHIRGSSRASGCVVNLKPLRYFGFPIFLRLSERLRKMGNPKYRRGFKFTTHPDALELPLMWKSPRKIFVNSMSDLFHESMPVSYLNQCFDVMRMADWHVYQILTKRPERMAAFFRDHDSIPDHVWLGTSVELAMYKTRIDTLRRIHARVRF